jgi:hypothetical protein
VATTIAPKKASVSTTNRNADSSLRMGFGKRRVLG